jgi:hypothetical protein
VQCSPYRKVMHRQIGRGVGQPSCGLFFSYHCRVWLTPGSFYPLYSVAAMVEPDEVASYVHLITNFESQTPASPRSLDDVLPLILRRVPRPSPPRAVVPIIALGAGIVDVGGVYVLWRLTTVYRGLGEARRLGIIYSRSNKFSRQKIKRTNIVLSDQSRQGRSVPARQAKRAAMSSASSFEQPWFRARPWLLPRLSTTPGAIIIVEARPRNGPLYTSSSDPPTRVFSTGQL